VWISRQEVARLAALLRLTVRETLRRYCRRANGKISLRERRNPQGQYDCIFLEEKKLTRAMPDGQTVTQTLRTCTAYEARPLQCRTWPFWKENLLSENAWKLAGRKCHGMDTGRSWAAQEIQSIRDATDWPDRPPTSGR
jgi:Fe-S-cluster containining protein